MPDPPSPPSPAASSRLEGRVLAGRYQLDHLIATGGMAQVWEATDQVLARKVAVKILHPHLAADASFVARFRAEAVAAARLAHPSIVSIYDTCSDNGTEAIVMELVRGTTLRHRLDEKGALEPGVAVAIVSQAADALATAHRAGVVHRDVKPANILLCDDGRAMVADFGIAKAMGGDLTTGGMMLGTAKYLAPEQVEGGPIGPQADVYALGVVLYEALCGRPPFSADTDAGTALARLHSEPLRPRQVRAGIPKRLEEVVLHAMARDPAARYADAGELRAALVAASHRVAEPPEVEPSPGDDSTIAVPRVAATPPGGTPKFTQTERSWLVPTLLILLVAVALGVAGVLFGHTDAGRQLFSKVHDSVGGSTTPAAVTGAAAFDPEGDGHEYDDRAQLVLDGDAATTWRTERYVQADIGNKAGVGIVLTLQQAADLTSLIVASPSANWSAEVYLAASPAADLAGWGQPVATMQQIKAGTTTFDLHGQPAGAVLLWITDVGAPNANVEIGELSVTS